MREMHIVEQEQDRVQSIVLFWLPLFTSTDGKNTSKEKKVNIRPQLYLANTAYDLNVYVLLKVTHCHNLHTPIAFSTDKLQ